LLLLFVNVVGFVVVVGVAVEVESSKLREREKEIVGAWTFLFGRIRVLLSGKKGLNFSEAYFFFLFSFFFFCLINFLSLSLSL
jgi:hypothetical protein